MTRDYLIGEGEYGGDDGWFFQGDGLGVYKTVTKS
jgi:hypothetical protein